MSKMSTKNELKYRMNQEVWEIEEVSEASSCLWNKSVVKGPTRIVGVTSLGDRYKLYIPPGMYYIDYSLKGDCPSWGEDELFPTEEAAQDEADRRNGHEARVKHTNAYDDVMAEMQPGEVVEEIVFGEYEGGEPCPAPVPLDKQGVLLSLDEAKPMMQNWGLDTGYGCANCYAITIYTNQRIGWVSEYDGSTTLRFVQRYPVPHMPEMYRGR